MIDGSYIPNPIDTIDVVLSDELNELTEKIAENAHEVWGKASWLKPEVEHVAQHIHCINLALYHVQKVDKSAFLSASVLNCVGHLVK